MRNMRAICKNKLNSPYAGWRASCGDSVESGEYVVGHHKPSPRCGSTRKTLERASVGMCTLWVTLNPQDVRRIVFLCQKSSFFP